MAVNKVNYGNTTLIDLTDTTATASDVAQGKYFYTNAGVRTEGTATGGGGGYNYSVLTSPSPVGLFAAYPSQKQLLYSWDLTQSLTDTVQGATITLSNATQNSNGITLTAANSYAEMPFYYRPYYTYEFDISAMNKTGTGHGRFITFGQADQGLIARSTGKWQTYLERQWAGDGGSYTSLAGQTLTISVGDDSPNFYKDGVFWFNPSRQQSFGYNNPMTIGSSGGQSLYTVTVSGIRVYWGV